MTVVIAGENAFVRQKELRALVSDFAKKHGELAVERLDGEEVDFAHVKRTLSETSLFAPERLVVLTNPGAHKAFQEDAEAILTDVPETTQVVVVETKPDKRTSYYKFLKKQELVDASPLDVRQLPTWAMEYARQRGSAIARADAQYLVDRVGDDQQRLASEIDKLSAATSEKISRVSIDALTDKSPQGKIFDLLDAAFGGNLVRAMDLYDEQRAQKVEPQEIMAMIGWQLRQIALAKFAKGHSLSEAKISGYGAQKAETAAKRMTQQQLKAAVARLTELDAQSKRSSLDVDEAVRTYLLTLASK